jgi:hypothetical protein
MTKLKETRNPRPCAFLYKWIETQLGNKRQCRRCGKLQHLELGHPDRSNSTCKTIGYFK